MTNVRYLVSRNKREGWYSGYFQLGADDRFQRTGTPSNDLDCVPYPDPLKKSIVRRYSEPIHCFFKERV